MKRSYLPEIILTLLLVVVNYFLFDLTKSNKYLASENVLLHYQLSKCNDYKGAK